MESIKVEPKRTPLNCRSPLLCHYDFIRARKQLIYRFQRTLTVIRALLSPRDWRETYGYPWVIRDLDLFRCLPNKRHLRFVRIRCYNSRDFFSVRISKWEKFSIWVRGEARGAERSNLESWLAYHVAFFVKTIRGTKYLLCIKVAVCRNDSCYEYWPQKIMTFPCSTKRVAESMLLVLNGIIPRRWV